MELKISENLRNLRKERGNTQDDLANHLGISVQAVSKWERGDGFPDITLLPYIASYYEVTVDDILGCNSIRKQEDIEAFKAQAQALINQGKRKERLELCRETLKKYPNDETVLSNLMYDLFSVDRIKNSDEIISVSGKLLHSENPEYRFEATQILAFTHSALGNYDTAVEYARSIPLNKDILCSVLKGDELVDHCKWFFGSICDKIYLTEHRLTKCANADYNAEERHKIKKSIYDIFHAVFSDGDFGFWEERLSRLCLYMAKYSVETGNIDRAFDELNQMCDHAEKYHHLDSMNHTSLLVRGLQYESSQSGKNSEKSVACELLYSIEKSPVFECLNSDIRIRKIKNRLSSLE